VFLGVLRGLIFFNNKFLCGSDFFLFFSHIHFAPLRETIRIFILNWQLEFGNRKLQIGHSLPFHRSTFSPPQYEIQATSDESRATASTIRAGTLDQIPKKIKKFSDSLTPFPTISYHFSVSSVTSVANVFFEPNAQLRPIVERRYFSVLGLCSGLVFCSPATSDERLETSNKTIL
jgi:hypothetical protein